jgi:hypothetical protein
MKNKTILIHQPDFIPWVGFIQRWKMADRLVLLDDAQFLKRGWHHRDRLILNDKETWFGVPVQQKGSYQKNINQIQIIQEEQWKQKLLKSIKLSYKKYPGFEVYYPWFESLISENYTTLDEINIRFLKELALVFKIETPIELSSKIPSNLKSTDRLIQLCHEHKGTTYLTGMGSKDYLSEEAFLSEGINVKWHQPENNIFYPQSSQDEIGLSILHHLLKYGTPQ